MTATPDERSEIPKVDVAKERRLGLFAGTAALMSMGLTIAAVPVAASGGPVHAGGSDDRRLLLEIVDAGDAQLIAMLMRVASVLLLAIVALYLYRVIRDRNPAHSHWIPVLGIVAFTIVAASTALGFSEVRDVAQQYLASGPRTAERAEQMLDDRRGGGSLRAANIGQLVGGIMFGVWLSLCAFEAMRVGVLTRFLGLFGIGAGFSSAIGLPFGAALFLGWLGSVGLLAMGWWPGGRPPAWDEGRAIDWAESDAKEAALKRARAER